MSLPLSIPTKLSGFWTISIPSAIHSKDVSLNRNDMDVSNKRSYTLSGHRNWDDVEYEEKEEKANKKEEMMLLLNYVTKLIALHNMCTSEIKKSREMVG